MEFKGIITTGQLEGMCQKKIKKEYGCDSKVCIQIRDNGTLINGDYAVSFALGKDGTLYLMNEPFKHGNYE